MLGGVIPQIVGGQIGSMSKELLHRPFISPSTHAHLQDAFDGVVNRAATIRAEVISRYGFIESPPD
jgi:hypothetical protein